MNVYLSSRKSWLSALCVFALLVAVIYSSLSVPSFASISFGENCLPCHSSGITISTNASETLQVEPEDTFWLEVDARGGDPSLIMVWSNVSHNVYFTFMPSTVEDNDPNDTQLDAGMISGLFQIIAPEIAGKFTIRTFAASTGGKGGFMDIEVTVGVGGVIAKPLFELVMEWITILGPLILGGIALIGMLVYSVTWRRIPEG